MRERTDARTIDGTRQRENIIIKTIRSHPEIHHNRLKRLVVPRYMATKTYENIIRDFIERKIVSVESVKNRKHYSVPLGFPDHPVKVHLSNLLQLVDEMATRLEELKRKYPRYSKKSKERLALDLTHVYYDTRLQVIKIFELLGKERPVVLGEYNTL